MYSIQPGPHSVPAGCFLPAGDRTVSLTAGLVPGTAQADRRGLVRAPHASDEAVPVPSTCKERGTSIHGLRQCTCALCEAAAWIADLSPLQAACAHKGHVPCAALRLSPVTLLCHFLPAGHAKHGAAPTGAFDWTQSGQSGAWGNPNKLHRNIENDIPMPCLPVLTLTA